MVKNINLLVLIQVIFLLVNLIKLEAVTWTGDWAFACDFKGNDLSNARVSGDKCGPKCVSTSGCTHFTWTTYNGGTCWMKKGPISKSNAFDTGDRTMVCGVVSGSNPPLPSGGITFSTINRCPYTVWPGFDGRSKSNNNWPLPFNGGWKLDPGQTVTFSVPKDLYAARVWGRTGCKIVNGQFKCDTGDCGPWVECGINGVHRGGVPPTSLAEFTLGDNGQDYYDVSLVDGYSIGITIIPKSPSGSSGDPNYWCKSPTCTKDINSFCPNELKKYNSNNQVIACYSACEKFQTDQYCCRGAFGLPGTCKSNTWPTNYPAKFKSACPTAYSFAYDDAKSTYFCRNTSYDVVFC